MHAFIMMEQDIIGNKNNYFLKNTTILELCQDVDIFSCMLTSMEADTYLCYSR